jgi:hypothetical protein
MLTTPRDLEGRRSGPDGNPAGKRVREHQRGDARRRVRVPYAARGGGGSFPRIDGALRERQGVGWRKFLLILAVLLATLAAFGTVRSREFRRKPFSQNEYTYFPLANGWLTLDVYGCCVV